MWETFSLDSLNNKDVVTMETRVLQLESGACKLASCFGGHCCHVLAKGQRP